MLRSQGLALEILTNSVEFILHSSVHILSLKQNQNRRRCFDEYPNKSQGVFCRNLLVRATARSSCQILSNGAPSEILLKGQRLKA